MWAHNWAHSWASNDKMLAVASLESNLYQLDMNVMNGAKMSFLAHSDGNFCFWSFSTRGWGISKQRAWKCFKALWIGWLWARNKVTCIHSHANKGGDISWRTEEPAPRRSSIRAFWHMRANEDDVYWRREVFFTFIDVFLHNIWMYVLKAKSEVLAKLKKWKTLVERQSDHVVKVLRPKNNLCLLDITNVCRRIGSFAWERRKSSKVQMWCFLKTNRIWRIVQLRGLTKNPWLRSTYLPTQRKRSWRRMTMFRKPTLRSK